MVRFCAPSQRPCASEPAVAVGVLEMRIGRGRQTSRAAGAVGAALRDPEPPRSSNAIEMGQARRAAGEERDAEASGTVICRTVSGGRGRSSVLGVLRPLRVAERLGILKGGEEGEQEEGLHADIIAAKFLGVSRKEG
jgi:hypothetical protein